MCCLHVTCTAISVNVIVFLKEFVFDDNKLSLIRVDVTALCIFVRMHYVYYKESVVFYRRVVLLTNRTCESRWTHCSRRCRNWSVQSKCMPSGWRLMKVMAIVLVFVWVYLSCSVVYVVFYGPLGTRVTAVCEILWFNFHCLDHVGWVGMMSSL